MRTNTQTYAQTYTHIQQAGLGGMVPQKHICLALIKPWQHRQTPQITKKNRVLQMGWYRKELVFPQVLSTPHQHFSTEPPRTRSRQHSMYPNLLCSAVQPLWSVLNKFCQMPVSCDAVPRLPGLRKCMHLGHQGSVEALEPRPIDSSF